MILIFIHSTWKFPTVPGKNVSPRVIIVDRDTGEKKYVKIVNVPLERLATVFAQNDRNFRTFHQKKKYI